MTKNVKIIAEEHPDGFVAYPVGLRGVIVGEGDTRAEAIADVTSAIQLQVETFGMIQEELKRIATSNSVSYSILSFGGFTHRR